MRVGRLLLAWGEMEAWRGRSREVDGVVVLPPLREVSGMSMSVAEEEMMDFRRAGGKKPRVRRERRAISVGWELWGRRTQESCVQGGGSRDVDERRFDGGVVSLLRDEEARRRDEVECQPLGSSEVAGASIREDDSVAETSWAMSSSCGAGTGFPLTPQASTGITMVLRTCGLSLCHIRLALRNTAA